MCVSQHHVVDRRDRQQQPDEQQHDRLDPPQVARCPAASASRGRSRGGQPLEAPASALAPAIDVGALIGPGRTAATVWWTTNSACTASVATSRRRSRAITASGSGQRMYQASSQVLVTEIASSAQPDAATQS